MRYLFLGDSITAANRNQMVKATDLGEGYVQYLQESFNTSKQAITCLNKAYKGACLHDVWRDIRRQLPTLVPIDRFSLLIGVNDVWLKREISDLKWQDELAQWPILLNDSIQNIQSILGELPWILIEPTANFQDPKMQQRLADIQQMTQTYSQSAPLCQYLKIHQSLQAKPDKYYQADHIHLTENGHRILAKEFLTLLSLL